MNYSCGVICAICKKDIPNNKPIYFKSDNIKWCEKCYNKKIKEKEMKKIKKKKVKISAAKFIKQMKIKKKKELEQKLIKIDKINVEKNKGTNKETVLEENVFKALQRAAKGVAKIGKVKYDKIAIRSRKDADKSKRIINILVKRVYAVEILLIDYLKEVNNDL